jgi:hypothetical protein
MATPLFSFTTLNGSDPAGHDSINVLIKSIEDQLASVSSGLSTGADTPGSVTTGQVLRWSGTTYANALVNAASLDTGAVIEAKIASSAVTETKIADSAVTSAKIANDTIVNADINSSAGIVDTKLATISTAGKVANSATTASASNGASTIVQRDASGNFAADTITASSFVGTATRATNIVGGSAGSLPYQTGTSATGMLANGSTGQVLTSNGTTLAPSWQAASIGENNIANGAVTETKIADVAVTNTKILYNAVTNDKILPQTLTLDRFAPSVGRYTPISITTSGDITVDYLSSTSGIASFTGTNPSIYQTFPGVSNRFMTINHASTPIVLSLPNTLGVTGDVITLCQTGAASVTITPKTGATATINGSTSATYVIGAQYSIVTLICLSNSGSNGTWIITGDYA